MGFRRRSLSPSTFLRPFAPPALPGFVATMDALTPEGRVGSGVAPVCSCFLADSDRSRRGPPAGPVWVWPMPLCQFLPECRVLSPTGFLASRDESSSHSVSNHLLPSPESWLRFSPRLTAWHGLSAVHTPRDF